MKGPEETYQALNIPLSSAGFQESLASRSRGFPSLGEVLVELGEGAYFKLEDGIINITLLCGRRGADTRNVAVEAETNLAETLFRILDEIPAPRIKMHAETASAETKKTIVRMNKDGPLAQIG